MIDFSFNNASFTSSGYCSASTPGGVRSVCATADSQYGDPLNWTGRTAPIVTGSTNVLDLQFSLCSVPTAPPAPSKLDHYGEHP